MSHRNENVLPSLQKSFGELCMSAFSTEGESVCVAMWFRSVKKYDVIIVLTRLEKFLKKSITQNALPSLQKSLVAAKSSADPWASESFLFVVKSSALTLCTVCWSAIFCFCHRDMMFITSVARAQSCWPVSLGLTVGSWHLYYWKSKELVLKSVWFV